MNENCQIHCGDCLEIMAGLPSGEFDAVVMDPPYCSGGVSEASRTAAKSQGCASKFGWFVGDNMGTAGIVFLIRSIAFEAVRVLKPSGSLVCFCDWRMVPNLAPAIESAGLRYQNLIVWDKGWAGLGQGFRAQHELIIHATNGSPEYYDRSTGNVLKYSRISKNKLHQTEKPVELMASLIKVVAPPGGLVLDPFAGSGTTGEAALMTGRRAVLIDRAEEHCETARARTSNALEYRADAGGQLDIFSQSGASE